MKVYYPKDKDGNIISFATPESQVYDSNGNKLSEKLNKATTSANGLMSKEDKSKLDGIATGANKYTHPSYTARTGKPTANQAPAFGGTATVSQITSDATGHVTGATDRTITIPSTLSNGTGTAGLIKTTSTVTSNSGYTPCPVISGVPYYKDSDTIYNTATTSTNGLMSKEDKSKLDGIAANANKYTLPTASTTLGGVKTTSTVTSTDGHTACPIIDGVPYYKDTNSTYTLSNITGTLGIAKGGTGATTAAGALTNLGLTATAAELNYCDGVTSNIQTQLNGKAASSHGTHVSYGTDAPKVAGTASVGSASTVSRSDHVHPAQTSVTGSAGSATTVAITKTNSTTSPVTYSLPFHKSLTENEENGNKSLGTNDGIRYRTLEGGADTTGTMDNHGYGILYLGNDISKDKENNKYGAIRIYGDNDKYTQLRGLNPSGNITLEFPTTGGTLALEGHTHDTFASLKVSSLVSTAGDSDIHVVLAGDKGALSTSSITGNELYTATRYYARSSAAGGSAVSAEKVNSNLTIKLNSGSSEGTDLFTFNGSTAKTVNITPSKIGALALTGNTLTGNITIDKTSDQSTVAYKANNGLREGFFGINKSDGKIGMYDTTNARWVIYNASDTKDTIFGHSGTILTESGTLTVKQSLRVGGPVEGKDANCGNLQLYFDQLEEPRYTSAVWIARASERFDESMDGRNFVIFGPYRQDVREAYVTTLYGKAVYAYGTSILYSSDDWFRPSDARLKTDEGYLDNSNEYTSKYITMWDNMKPRAFRMLRDDESNAKLHLGYFAQETEEALYKAGLTDKDFFGINKCNDFTMNLNQENEDVEYLDVLYSLSYSECAILTDIKLRQVVNEIIPKLQTKNDILEKTITSMQTQIDNLTAMIAEMKGGK